VHVEQRGGEDIPQRGGVQEVVQQHPRRRRRPEARGLHPSTFRLNVSALRGIEVACRACLGGG